MPDRTRIVTPGPERTTVRLENGEVTRPPAHWDFLPAGDATHTRRVKQDGPTWTVRVRRGRRDISLGVWAERTAIERHRAALEQERSSESYAKQRAASARRRETKQARYEEEFRRATLAFLDFAPVYADLSERLATAITAQTIAIGSGTVARTERLSLERRVEAAVIAWLRHQTTGYDTMRIARVKGRRRDVRRALAERSRELLESYRRGEPVVRDACPLEKALRSPT